MHGKARVEHGEDAQSTIAPRDGVTIERESHVSHDAAVRKTRLDADSRIGQFRGYGASFGHTAAIN